VSTSVVPQRLGPVNARLANRGQVFKLGEQWRCGCGLEHSFGVYAAAHWQDVLEHKCECGVARAFRAGKVIEHVPAGNAAQKVVRNSLA
jgi:hypothetical protein